MKALNTSLEYIRDVGWSVVQTYYKQWICQSGSSKNWMDHGRWQWTSKNLTRISLIAADMPNVIF